jgi:hypothetical protein
VDTHVPGGLIKEVAPVKKNLLHGDPPFISSCRVEAMPARRVEQAPPCLSAQVPKCHHPHNTTIHLGSLETFHHPIAPHWIWKTTQIRSCERFPSPSFRAPRRTGKCADILSTIFFTILLGSFAWPVWSNLKRVHCRLDEVFAKIEALQQSIKVPVIFPRVRAGG